ncbi:hypothetical protein LOK49_Contig164G00002 [Camellia lanceoleosa]|nr:hypothetical protein LOK49_Contig164G00002 [Camellia lanceoleosa]
MDPHFHAVPHDLGLSMDAIIDFKHGSSFTETYIISEIIA